MIVLSCLFVAAVFLLLQSGSLNPNKRFTGLYKVRISDTAFKIVQKDQVPDYKAQGFKVEKHYSI